MLMWVLLHSTGKCRAWIGVGSKKGRRRGSDKEPTVMAHVQRSQRRRQKVVHWGTDQIQKGGWWERDNKIWGAVVFGGEGLAV